MLQISCNLHCKVLIACRALCHPDQQSGSMAIWAGHREFRATGSTSTAVHRSIVCDGTVISRPKDACPPGQPHGECGQLGSNRALCPPAVVLVCKAKALATRSALECTVCRAKWRPAIERLLTSKALARECCHQGGRGGEGGILQVLEQGLFRELADVCMVISKGQTAMERQGIAVTVLIHVQQA